MSGARHRKKGDRVEREIVAMLGELGVKAERYPLSGASRFRGSGHDLDVYAFGREQTPLVFEVKARKKGNGFSVLERWLGDYDGLIMKRNNVDPFVALPWQTFVSMLLKINKKESVSLQLVDKKQQPDAT